MSNSVRTGTLRIPFVAIVWCIVNCGFAAFAADEQSEEGVEDSSVGLPENYAKNYLIARSTVSPDQKFAVIYPMIEAEEAADDANHPERIKNYLVVLQPFAVVKSLDTKWPYFQNESHGGLRAEWSDDSSVALIVLDAKWGPRDVFLVEFHEGKLSRITNVAQKAHDFLVPNYRQAKAERYNDLFDFVFVEDASFKLEDASRVVIDATAETSPNDLGLAPRAWTGHVHAVWDIAQAKFMSSEVSGKRRGADAYRNRAESDAEDKHYGNAVKAMRKAIELEPKNGRYYSDLAWYQLLNRKPTEAIAAARKALELSPKDALTININLAHGYLFNNQFEKAKAIYLENKDAKIPDDKANGDEPGDHARTFYQAVLDDFKKLEEAGITHPDMQKVKALLAGKAEQNSSAAPDRIDGKQSPGTIARATRRYDTEKCDLWLTIEVTL